MHYHYAIPAYRLHGIGLRALSNIQLRSSILAWVHETRVRYDWWPPIVQLDRVVLIGLDCHSALLKLNDASEKQPRLGGGSVKCSVKSREI